MPSCIPLISFLCKSQSLYMLHAGFVQCLLSPKRLRVDFMSINQADPIFRTYIDVTQA